jgi:hypothetical protein
MADKIDAQASRYSLPHIRIESFRKISDYRPPGLKIEPRPSTHERFSHGAKLSGELSQALAAAHRIIQARDHAVGEGRAGTYLEIETSPGDALPDLTWTSQGIRLGAIRATDNETQVGGLFVPTTAESFLADKVAQYATGSPSDDLEARIDKLERIAIGTVETLWSDKRALPPPGVAMWWECWCWRKLARNLIRPAERLGLRVSDNRLYFPEFEVIPVYASREEMERLLLHSDAVEELRRATDSPHVFTHDLGAYQGALVEDLARRTTAAPGDAVAACLLDTGVARAHPLIAPSLPPENQHAVDERWGKDDHKRNGHGTLMAGTALFGDLTYPLADQRAIALSHNLESVTLVPPDGFAPTEPHNYGFVTQGAISLPEIAAPERRRVFCMAVTNEDVSGDVPTTWSAALDQAAAGTMVADGAGNGGAPRRLLLVSAGNIPDTARPEQAAEPAAYPIEDPAQAWNVLTVGGFTDRDDIAHPDYQGWTAAAVVGDRSPFSRVSCGWPSATPLKPEIVLEAGNRALSPGGRELVAGIESLSLLTTNKDFITHPLTAFWGTSPATAQAAGMAASIVTAHPDYWPETVRALMVHSARWTPQMLRRFNGCGGRKSRHILLAREFGYGVPSLERALASASSDLALIAQAEMKPFKRAWVLNKQGKPEYRDPVFNQIDYYPLPWPKRGLEALGEKLVELKITLSYFIEPSPGQHAPVTPARYRSHGLRFDLKKSDETEADFYSRINDLERQDGEERVKPESDDQWVFGANSRARNAAGSLHCDVWRGRAADLAGRHLLAVYPVSGWWKERVPQKRYDSRTRYALIATITCVEEEVDLHAEVQSLVDIAAEAQT